MEREEVLQVLARLQAHRQDRFRIVRLGVFGSVARDRAGQASDVDIVVELERTDLLILVGVKQELEELLHMPIDIVRYREGMNPYLNDGLSKKRSMYDAELASEILRQVLWSAEPVARRFEPIRSPEDLVTSDTGLEKLDAICM